MGGENLFGGGLKGMIEKQLADNQMTPAVPLPIFDGILKQLEDFEKALDSAAIGFQRFNIGDETLEPGECEIGILIPRQFVKNRLDDLSDELKQWEFILNTFSEVATRKVVPLEIKTLSSSDLMIYIKAIPDVAAALARAVGSIVDAYKKVSDYAQ